MGLRLSNSQLEAVNHQEGALLVIAGPGSGKTRVLTERIRRLLSSDHGHFHVLALTFTNKAANEMKERLVDVPDILARAFIGTIHSFCTDLLAQRGSSVGIDKIPQIIDSIRDKKIILQQAIEKDPDLVHELRLAGDKKEQNNKLNYWLNKITTFKSLLRSPVDVPDDIDSKIYEAFNIEMRACSAVDFDDLLLLTYRLLNDRPKIADLYRRLYQYICIDEAQDLNYAQYNLIKSLAGNDYSNIMMVGDPKQSIYGFNTADPKYMDEFKSDFQANIIELKENYRSSIKVVNAAKSLKPNYQVQGILAIKGEVNCYTASDEDDEAKYVLDKINDLVSNGHPDIEGNINLNKCAVLARTRYSMLTIENKLKNSKWTYYKQWAARYENVSAIMMEYELCLKILANPKNQAYKNQLLQRWDIQNDNISKFDGIEMFNYLQVNCRHSNFIPCINAINALKWQSGNLLFCEGLDVLSSYADSCQEEEKRSLYEDIAVLRNEWDRYLRSKVGGNEDLGSFLTHLALGTTQQMHQDGLALITIHSAKGLEFDVVFVIGMAEGTFPDYRALNSNIALEEENRNAFVAVSRAKRLLYLTYPKNKMMPWGALRQQQPSRYLRKIGLIE